MATRPGAVIHAATVLYVSHTAAPSRLGIRCRRHATVTVEASVDAWRATFQPARVTCKRCLQGRRRAQRYDEVPALV